MLITLCQDCLAGKKLMYTCICFKMYRTTEHKNTQYEKSETDIHNVVTHINRLILLTKTQKRCK